MLLEKEIIGPATHWYRDEATGLPRKLVVTPELTKHWHEQGNKMLGFGLTVPVPCEHDFNAHPMTPADKLKNNAGWVKEFKLKNDVLFGVVDIQDEELVKKLPKTIRWTSPWISSFTDGQNRDWRNVISHLALTTRPRIIRQAPFSGIAAALSIATPIYTSGAEPNGKGLDLRGLDKSFCLSKAGQLVNRKKDKALCPKFPKAFSLYAGGIKLADDDPFLMDSDDEEEDDDSGTDDAASKANGGESKPPSKGSKGDDPFADQIGDIDSAEANPLAPEESAAGAGDTIPITELLAQLLPILGVQMPDPRFITSDTFLRELCTAMITKVTSLAQGQSGQQTPGQPPNQPPKLNQPPQPGGQPNPLIQQEQQPMYMSLEEINKIGDTTMKTIALSMYNENVKLRAEADVDRKKLNSLNDAKLREENTKRQSRVQLLSKLSPRVKADLDAMLALPSMALSMGDGGAVVDPMAQTLAVLEKGLADMPRLLLTDHTALSQQAHPTDDDALSQDAADKISDEFARKMGCPPEKKAAS